MLHVDEAATLVGVTELRKEIPRILKEIGKRKIVLTHRNRPVGVVMEYKEYERWGKLIEDLEDQVLGSIALKRASRSKKKLIPLEEVEKRLSIR